MKAIYKALVDTLVEMGFITIMVLITTLLIQGMITQRATGFEDFDLLIGLFLLSPAICLCFYKNYNYYRRQK